MGEARRNRLEGKKAEMERCEGCGKYTFNRDNIEVELPDKTVKKHTFCSVCETALKADMTKFEDEAKKPKLFVPGKKKILIHKN